MSEKYIDLAETIRDDVEPTRVGEAYMWTALTWLDEHSDQVPGRTITESELTQIANYEEARETTLRQKLESALFTVGVTVVADPVPPNVERLEKIVWGINSPIASISGEKAHRLAKWLHAHGVRAPEADDE